MELHQLEYVLALNKYKSFSIAAKHVNISQPTISHQINKLENELGVKLFVRARHAVLTTKAGEEFLVYAKRILSERAKALNSMNDFAKLKKGTIKIGGIPTIYNLGLISVIASFQKKYPNINMELLEANSDNLTSMINLSEIDVAFITSPYISEQKIDFHPLINDEMVLVIPSSHDLASRKTVDLSNLSNERFFLIRQSTGLRNTILQLCIEAGFVPNIFLESGHIETIKGFIEEGMGVTIISRRTALSILSSKTKILNLSKTVERVTGLAISKNNNLVIIKTFKDFVLSQFPI